MQLPPFSVILSWPTANYDDPDTRGPALIIVNCVFMTLVVIAVAARFYSRVCIRKWIGIDDIMMIFAFIFTIAMTTVVVLAQVKFGWDRHIWDLEPQMIKGASVVAFVAKITFTLAGTFTRLSLICFYYRLIKDSGIKWFVWVLHASVLWQIALCITFICLTVFLCNPVSAYWEYPPRAHFTCLDEGKVMLGGGIVSSFSDLMVVVLPIPIIMRLQMPLLNRIGVCILLCLGVIVTAAGSVRTYWTWRSLMESWDETWYAYPLWIAGAVEIDLGVICACAPALKTLLQKPIQRLTCRISSKLSSLRSPNNSPTTSAAAKPTSRFNPLRSLPWFQITRLDFEHTRMGTESRDSDVELGKSVPMELQERDGGQENAAVDKSSRPTSPSLQIVMRHSFDQCSEHSSSRLRPNGPVSGEWLSNGS